MKLVECFFEFFSKFLPITEMKILLVRDPLTSSPSFGPSCGRIIVRRWVTDESLIPIESAQMREPLAPLQQSFCQSISLSSFMMILIKGIGDSLSNCMTHKLWLIQVKAYLQSEEFRLKFCQKNVTLRRFWLCLFPRQDFKWNFWLLMLFHMILD